MATNPLPKKMSISTQIMRSKKVWVLVFPLKCLLLSD